jgi:hypothetical protein
MAHFLGTIQGCRGEASRLGGKGSGLRSVAASWEGSVRVYLTSNNDVDWATVRLEPWQGSGRSVLLYDGPVSGDGAKDFVAPKRKAKRS